MPCRQRHGLCHVRGGFVAAWPLAATPTLPGGLVDLQLPA